MNAILSAAQDWAIGKDNQLLFHLKEDMRRFRVLTTGGTVIMGRRTLESLPAGKPLPNRRNIVVTHDMAQPSFFRLMNRFNSALISIINRNSTSPMENSAC